MYIKSLRITNYRSISDSGTLAFSPGFNLIVGANNAGKSSLLSCLSGRFTCEPHLSLEAKPRRDDRLIEVSTADMEVTESGASVGRILLNQMHGDRYFPWPTDTPNAREQAARVFERFLAAPEISFLVRMLVTPGQAVPNVVSAGTPTTRVYGSRTNGDQYLSLNVSVLSDRRFGRVDMAVVANPPQDDGLPVGQALIKRIYKFDAERLSLGAGAIGTNRELRPDAQNLPEVLNHLQNDHEGFRIFNQLVTRVFPHVRQVSVRPHPNGGSQLEILVWQFDPKTRREDLAIPLLKCGTGLGQVLAMLYVATLSEDPRTIIIDEPSSFLNPGAARTLIGILGEFKVHQYIIATHSPEIISELADAPVTLVTWSNSTSSFQQAKRTTGHVASGILSEIGARLSDVFGFDSVIWIEGQSDADAIKALLEAKNQRQRRIAILPVRDTGSFKRRKIAEVLAIYRVLSLGDAVLPPALAFLFDKESRSETEQEDARRESAGKVRFLRRAMIENYFLRADLLAARYNEVGREHQIAIPEYRVQSWLDVNAARFGPRDVQPFSPGWLERANGAALLESLFSDLSEARLDYRKTRDVAELAVKLFAVDAGEAEEILEPIRDVLEPSSAAPDQ